MPKASKKTSHKTEPKLEKRTKRDQKLYSNIHNHKHNHDIYQPEGAGNAKNIHTNPEPEQERNKHPFSPILILNSNRNPSAEKNQATNKI